ncbi:sugar phosphate isomerase/epimerase [Nocardia sp. NRRL S-836]|uniref:sugar phosphate isomerase/epimerase family protein n=1 Tax=Nocardia sp. NRRL S-836 TaxID=1519492 RepID=UPI0006AE2410|nr:TIM barrel protein [Nocardia sp. NRRL S-836]KOV89012.1 xylose isomerase [Nocardia sp. NRRL S-836]
MLIPGVVSVTFRQLPVEEIGALALDCGLQAVEWGADVHVPPGDFAAARRALDTGLKVAAYGSYYRAGVTDRAELAAVLETAAELDAPYVRVWAGTSGSAECADRGAVVEALQHAVEHADAMGTRIALEYHRNTLTDTLDSTVRLLDEVDGVVPYWQPSGGQDVFSAVHEVRTLEPVTAHVFSWGPGGFTDRLPLSARRDLWKPVLGELARDGIERNALLEFVRDDSVEQFREDAKTLVGYVSAL